MTHEEWKRLSRRNKILAQASDLVGAFLHYDRKDDEDLPRGAIEDAIRKGEVKPQEIVDSFTASFYANLRL